VDKTIRLWDTTSWTLKSELTGHEGDLRCLAFAPDGHTLASASRDATIRLWDVDQGQEKSVLIKHKIEAKAVAYSPDGTLLATSCCLDGNPNGGEIRIFETATGKERPGEWSKRGALSLAFSPDGTKLATGAPGFPSLHVYDVKSGKTLQAVQSASTRHLAFSPDGKTLATAHGQGGRRGNGSIQLWDTTTWAERGFLQGHQMLCLMVMFSRDGKSLASASVDGTARVWDLPAPAKEMRARR
jgi:WD40 repeat protein